MGLPLKKISITGFKSIRSLKDLTLTQLNILVGANGSGKSNFISFFRMLRAMSEERFSAYVTKNGGADGFFFGGPKETGVIETHLEFGKNEYKFSLTPTVSSDIMIENEDILYTGGGNWVYYGGGRESNLKSWEKKKSNWGSYPAAEHYVYEAISNWTIYHFHDTSMMAPMRRDHSIRDFRELNSDASNIAAFLFLLKTKYYDIYEKVKETVQLVVPFFDDFLLNPEEKGKHELVRLEWLQKGSSFPYQPFQLSDGTIRFICLVTVLLQPNPPATIIIDEPELGLHPFALDVLSGIISEASENVQLIISTQSATLLNHFQAGDIIVADREKGASRFLRLDEATLREWLREFSLGELWQKNIFDGGPTYE